uniref:Sugar phosphate transporter domain-containing protein n=1 Tax=Chrysotila carterae TaxID=13221 RepID=A0A7S4EUQ6_CHRCT
MVGRVALVSLGVLLLEHCSTVTLTRYTQQRADVTRASPTVAVLLTELLKMCFSVGLELTSLFGIGSASSPRKLHAAVCLRQWDTMRLAVPSLLYTLQNNLIFVALAHLEVVTFQVLYQAKLLITAVLSVIFLGHRLTAMQWAALLMLTIGVVAVELSNSEEVPQAKRSRRNVQQDTFTLGVGTVSAFAAALLSSTAGIYFEVIVKAKELDAPSLWTRNVQLGLFSIPLAFGGVLVAGPASWDPNVLLQGFDWVVILLVLLNASGGLVVASVIKYGDNILKVLQRAHSLLHLAACPALISVRIQLVSVSTARRGKPSTAVAAAAAQNFTTASSVVFGTLLSVVLFGFRPKLQATPAPIQLHWSASRALQRTATSYA